MGMSANCDWVCPAWYQPRDFLTDDWFPEYCAAQNVSDGTVRAEPHLFQLEF